MSASREGGEGGGERLAPCAPHLSLSHARAAAVVSLSSLALARARALALSPRLARSYYSLRKNGERLRDATTDVYASEV